MKFQSKFGSYRIIFSQGALDALNQYVQRSPEQNESGGVLLGRLLYSGHIVVDEITTPQPNDKATHTTFFRSDDHQTLINDAWKRSEGTCLYLGEWHTHAEEIPFPSKVDLDDWHRRLQTDKPSIDSTLFLIVGTCAISLYEGRRDPDCGTGWHELTIPVWINE